jgi:hypothetical protein
MTEEKKEGECCSSKGCGSCCFTKLLIGMLIGAFIFASGMWFAKASCHSCHMGYNYCPFIKAPSK